jgi:hypothetical protein
MATRPIREPRAPLGSVLMRPIEWAHGQSLRLLEWFNQERWTLMLTLLALLITNSFLLYLLLQGQDTRALAFVIILFVIVLSWLVPELSIAVLIVGGTGLYINLLFYTTGGAFGTGSRPILLALLLVVSLRAIYEYLRTPPAERPRVFTWLTILLAMFWVYYMAHVLYINLFHYNTPSLEDPKSVLGFPRRGLIRYFDGHVLWIGVIPMVILLRNYERAKRVLFLVGLAAFSGGIGIFLDYLISLPEFWKVAFMIQRAGESQEGYRVSAPAPIHLVVLLMWYVLYRVGYLKWWQNLIALLYLVSAALAVAVMKTRMLWGVIMLFLPLVLLLKPSKAQLRQLRVFGFAGLLAAALLLHPRIYDLTTQITREVSQRWQRNYAFGGDPRNDPSYQGRIRERESWEQHYATLSLADKLFGRGLEERYGYYVSLYALGYGPQYRQVYIEKARLHFSWLARLLHIGVLGTLLLALLLAIAIVRAIQVLIVIPQPSVKALVFAAFASTAGIIPYDAIQHYTLIEFSVLPIVFSWAIVEAALYWHRTGQLPDETND